MLERTDRALRALALLLLLPLLPSLPLAQEGQGEGDGGDREKEEREWQIQATDPVDAVLQRHHAAHGGREELRAIRNFSFRWIPVKPGARPDQMVEGPPLAVEVKYAGARRMLRVEEALDGKQIVKLSDGVDTRVWVDGEERNVPQLTAAAREEAIALLGFLDLLYQPDSLELSRKVEGPRVRNDVKYTLMRLEFHPSRNIRTAFGNYYNPDTGLVDRMDVFSLGTLRRLYSIWFEDYVTLGKIRFPSRMVFKDPEGKLQQVWRFEEPRINADIPAERFTGR